MNNVLGSNGRDLCPKCGGETIGGVDLEKPLGFCSSCQWCTHAFNEEHNEMLLGLSSSLSMLKDLTESMDKDVKAKRDWRKATREIANTLLLKLSWQMKKDN